MRRTSSRRRTKGRPGRSRYVDKVAADDGIRKVQVLDAETSGCTTNGDFARFLSYAYRSLKEVVTRLELCQRLYPALLDQPVGVLIDEGNQISRMTHALMQRLGTPTDGPSA